MGEEFVGGVKAEGVVAMLKQHALSDWGIEEVQEKVTQAHAPPKEATKSKGNNVYMLLGF